MKVDRTTPPPVKDFARLTLPPKDVRVLSNGVVINIIRTGNAPANRVSLNWAYGSSRMNGAYASLMVPAMLTQGTRSRSAEQIMDEIDFLGAFLGETSGTSYTALQFLALTEFTDKVLDILAEMAVNPSFPSDKFAALKRKAVSKKEISLKQTHYVAKETLATLVAGPDHPYCRFYTPEDIASATLEQVREAWHDGLKHSEINIFASGKIDDEILTAIEKFALKIRPHAEKPLPDIIVPFTPALPQLKRIEMPGAQQASIAMAIPTIPRSHPDYIALRIAVTALGGYFGSRLMSNIREEKGLTYGITAYLAGALEGSAINISADCDNSYVETVLDEIRKEMHLLVTQSMDMEEFRRLRSFYMTTLASTVESFKTIGEFYESELTVGLPKDYFLNQQLVLETITPDGLRDVANKYFRFDDAIIVTACPI